MDAPFDLVVVGLLRNQGTIVEAIANGVTQIRQLRYFFLLGGVDCTISIKGMDEEDTSTLAAGILLQSFLIRSRSCSTPSGRTRDLGQPMPLGIL